MINIETDTGTTRIELLDNPFVNDWKEHFIYMLDNAEYNHQLIDYPYANYQFSWKDDHKEIRKRIIPIIDIIKELNNMGINFPITIDDIDNEITKIENSWGWFESGSIELDALLDEDGSFVEYQYKEVPAVSSDFTHLLNKIHRCCTVAVRNLHAIKSDGNTIELYWSDDDPYNSKFNIDYNDVDKFYALMEQGNLGIHSVDCIIPTKRKQQYYNNITSSGSIQTIEFHFDFNEPEILGIDCNDNKVFFKDIPGNYHQYADDSDDYDVWIAIDIIGKNYQEAFFDYEDPREWDVTQPLGHSAGFHVNLSDPPATLQSLIRGDDMQNWFKEYNLNYKTHMNNYPLGKVTEGKEHLQATKDKCIITWIV